MDERGKIFTDNLRKYKWFLGHMSAKFTNSKLTRIAHRKPPAKSNDKSPMLIVQTATDQKYALLFHITPFHLGNLGKFDVIFFIILYINYNITYYNIT